MFPQEPETDVRDRLTEWLSQPGDVVAERGPNCRSAGYRLEAAFTQYPRPKELKIPDTTGHARLMQAPEYVTGLNRHPGIILSDVLPHSSGEAAGLEPNDVVLAIDGRPVIEATQVQAEIMQRTIGHKITLDILRGTQQMQKEVAILERRNSPPLLADLVNSQSNLVRRLGILAMTLDENLTPSLLETRRLSGVVVAAIPA